MAPLCLKRIVKVRLSRRGGSSTMQWEKDRNKNLPAREGEETWRCRACRRGFDSKAKLSVHYFKKHGRIATYRLSAQGTRCHACNTECWAEGRLGVHLRSSAACVRARHAEGKRAREVAPGIRSKVRPKADVDQTSTRRQNQTGNKHVAPLPVKPFGKTWQGRL